MNTPHIEDPLRRNVDGRGGNDAPDEDDYRLRKQAEEGVGVFVTRLLERAAELALNPRPEHGRREPDVQDQNNQEFLDFLNMATAQNARPFGKLTRLRREPIKGLP